MVFVLFILLLAEIFSVFTMEISDAVYEYWQTDSIFKENHTWPDLPRSVFPKMIRPFLFSLIVISLPLYANILHGKLGKLSKSAVPPPLPNTR